MPMHKALFVIVFLCFSATVLGMTLTIVSGNAAKLLSLKQRFAALGLTTPLMQKDLQLIELQADVLKVAEFKAEQAFAALNCPVLVEDGGLVVDSLNTFPGAYTKPFLEAVGLPGFLKLAAPLPASAHFISAVVYKDEFTTVSFFGDKHRPGFIVEPRGVSSHEAWSSIWEVFSPVGSVKTLSEMSAGERNQDEYKACPDPLDEFCAWFKNYLGN